MIEVDGYYIKEEFYSEYIKLYIKYITEDLIPCSTVNKRGELILSIVDKITFYKFLRTLNNLGVK